MNLRWGIVSAGKISHDFVNALSTLPEGEHTVVAIGARHLENAKAFAKLHEIPTYYEGYNSLGENPNIDIVYIGALSPQHYEISKIMLNYGKHVLCEKPLCMNEKQTKSLLQYAKSKNLFFMEALWARFFPAYRYLRQRIDNGDLGEIQHVEGSMIVPINDLDRIIKKELGGGTVIDIGIYSIQAALWVFRESPIEIKASGELNDDGVDTSMVAELTFSGGRKANISTGSIGFGANEFIITGTKGKMILHPIFAPIKLTDIDGTVISYTLPEAKHEFFFWNTSGLRYEAAAVRKAIMDGKVEEETMTHEESLRLARVEDEIRRQIGVTYPEDEQEF